jgi:hypothetical protein
MFYDNSKESFVYYSDHIIPYRYLETISRKYVIIFDCKKIYINMEEELKKYEENLKKLQSLKFQSLEKVDVNASSVEGQMPVDCSSSCVKKMEVEKKSVFAKLKKYNNTNLKAATIPAIKGSNIPNTSNNLKKEDKEYILKENANRYSYGGKLANYDILKKIDKKVLDKTYAMTFAVFKKMLQDKKNKN